jgi:opacity protein-like surface antigen
MTKKLALVAMFGLGAAVAAPAAAEAQVLPLSVEARGGVAFPTGDFGDAVKSGFGFGVTAKFRVLPLISVYGGWERASFDAKEDEASNEFDDLDITGSVEDSGFRLGGQVDLPLSGLTGFSPYVQAGVLYNTTTFKASGGGMSVSFDSDRAFGYEAGAGVAIPLGLVLKVTPEVRYRSYKPKFEGETTDEPLSYFLAGVGLQFSF